MKTALLIFTLALGTTITANARIVEREDNARVSKGSGSNIGGGNVGSEYLATWCKGQTSLLRNYKERARLKLDNTGDYNVANKLLANGIEQALASGTNAKESFLHKSLVRGLTISTHLGAGLGGSPERKAMVANNVLNSYYDFMINVVAKNLDLNGQIPYMNASASNMDERAARFEETFVTYASSQLNWILENLVKETRLGNRTQTVPVGDARSVIKVTLTLAAGTAKDLDESLWNYRFSCAINELNMLTDTLAAYDQGNMEMFEDEKQALDYTAKELRRISTSLSASDACL